MNVTHLMCPLVYHFARGNSFEYFALKMAMITYWLLTDAHEDASLGSPLATFYLLGSHPHFPIPHSQARLELLECTQVQEECIDM